MTVNPNLPRAEYPRPQMVRDSYICLNGKWMFELDHGCSGRARGLQNAPTLSGEINVPFCPESKLSGVEYKDFMACVWYKRTVEIQKSEKRIILHIDACDYACEVYVNGNSCGIHYGGSVPVVHDITDKVVDGKNIITVCAEDNQRSGCQPVGKQSNGYYSAGCSYTRTTGIWQTVWMEEVPNAYISNIKLTQNAALGEVSYEILCENADGMKLGCTCSFEGKPMGQVEAVVIGRVARFVLRVDERHLWNVGEGNLYDVTLTLGDDTVSTYFGLRDIVYNGRALVLNGKVVYQRLVLDQGFYPDGVWTAPTDEELINDIKRSLAMGFNGARLHQKVFEPRFLYHCDRLGYIVWGEHGNWGLDISKPTAWAGFLPEWLEILQRDYNHPAIIGWCPLNETQRDQDKRFVSMLYDMTKAYDPSRMFIDCSGWEHVKTEVVDEHNYDQNPDSLRENYEPLKEGKPPLRENAYVHVHGTASVSFVSEYGGIAWSLGEGAWGYGNAPKTEEEFLSRIKGLTDALLDNECLSAYCYTQLTDVEQEQNGLYTYDRKPKFPPEVIHAILSRKAAIEE
ncbi:MAG: beta-galactosidase [Clostridia bacterium]|nr:beta-galactosidase [Clostridia bacterium]